MSLSSSNIVPPLSLSDSSEEKIWTTMGRIRVEVCLISARGLPRSSSLWKQQWFAVGWIDPENKYCSKIDASGSSNPSWRTKFAMCLEDSDPKLQGLSLHVEVYAREPFFLRERLHGTAEIQLKEFFGKFGNNSEGSRAGTPEVGSFQLRRKKSDKPRGFVDVSVQISEDRVGVPSFSANDDEGGIRLPDQKTSLPLPIDGSMQPYSSQPYPAYINQNNNYPPSHLSGPAYPPPVASSYQSSSSVPPPPRTPPPPPPPSHVGFVPTFLPSTGPLPQSYMNLPSSNTGGRPAGAGPGFAAGVGAGALAAGAVIFGDDFMSAFDYPMGLQSGSLTVSMDPPF
ncbi:hypothetical protein H6P81_014676 [Aristolochia fimbriata]|uniref:C2 domain-containing protein n=1 Tax=Aristolochia fimbriata TaxID=158543 RepID=A0AAV7E654_ARIFI|nr:hypothetical protein H6P81_014676 [Aristolochia fimbriata]